jgi:hypothetical protein
LRVDTDPVFEQEQHVKANSFAALSDILIASIYKEKFPNRGPLTLNDV